MREMREKRRPTLDELREMPLDLWRLEILQTVVDAEAAGHEDIGKEGASMLLSDPDITPEKVVELRQKLERARWAISAKEITAASIAV